LVLGAGPVLGPVLVRAPVLEPATGPILVLGLLLGLLLSLVLVQIQMRAEAGPRTRGEGWEEELEGGQGQIDRWRRRQKELLQPGAALPLTPKPELGAAKALEAE
jgi:hypothetical protein